MKISIPKKIKIFSFVLSILGSILMFSLWVGYAKGQAGNTNGDFLEQAFTPAIQSDAIVGWDSIGTDKMSVGKYILKEGTEIKIWWKNKGINRRPSLIISISKFLLRMTMVLAVTMIIYNGVHYVIKASKGENPKEILNNILYIWVGILLALFSVIIIRLVSSVGSSSFNEISYLSSSIFIS